MTNPTPRQVIEIREIGGEALAARLRDLTPRVFEAMGAPGVVEVPWSAEETESYVEQGRGERLGPSTLTAFSAVCGVGRSARANVTLDTTRWGPSHVHSVAVQCMWRVGEAYVGGYGSCDGDGPVTSLTLDGEPAGIEALRAALNEER